MTDLRGKWKYTRFTMCRWKSVKLSVMIAHENKTKIYHKSRCRVKTAELPLLVAYNTTGFIFHLKKYCFLSREIAYYAKCYDSYLLLPQSHSFLWIMYLRNDLALAESNSASYLSWKETSEELPASGRCVQGSKTIHIWTCTHFLWGHHQLKIQKTLTQGK